jgi:hypothetical protein
MAFQIKRGTNSQRLGYTASSGELIYATDTKILYVGDGTTPGGVTVGTVSSAGNFTLNGLSGSVVLTAGTGLTLSVSGNTLTFANIGGACAGVNSVNGLSGAIVFASGSGMTLSVSGNTLTFATTGAPSGLSQYVESINGSTGVVTNVAFTNIAQSFSAKQSFSQGITVTNTLNFNPFTNDYSNNVISFGVSGSTLNSTISTGKISIMPQSIFVGPDNLLFDVVYDAFGQGYTTTAPGIYIGTNILDNTSRSPQGPFTAIGNGIMNGGLTFPTGLGSRNYSYGVFMGNGILGSATYGNINENVFIGDDILLTCGITSAVSGGLFRNVLVGSFIGKLNQNGEVNLSDNILMGDKVFGDNSSVNINSTGNVILGSQIGANATNFVSKSSIIIGDKALYKIPSNAGLTYDNIVMIGGRNQATDSSSNRNRDLPFGESTQLLICSGFTSWIYGNSAGNILLGEPRTVGRPAEKLHVAGNIYAGGTYLYLANQFTPGSSAANGTTGAFAWDNDYIYVCIGTNSWRRAGLTSW